jgi:carbamoyl-phosphate synthase/aspartate carbamoyltransferase/dihydroorotase
MVGYPQTLTDPSYFGQIVVFTYPLLGNYGVPDLGETDEFGLSVFAESLTHNVTAAGLIVQELCDHPSHWQMKQTLEEFMREQKMSGLCGVDTRALTKHLREHGSMSGVIRAYSHEKAPVSSQLWENPNRENILHHVSCVQPRVFNPGGKFHVLLVDCGVKTSIIRYVVPL